MKTRFFTFLFFTFHLSLFTLPLSAQEMRELRGRVVDVATGEGVAGVQVQAYNNALYASMTDEQGAYVISVPEWVTSLTLWADGYTRVQQPVGKGQTVEDVKLYSALFGETYSAQTSAVSKKTALVTHLNNDMSVDRQIQQSLGGDMLTNIRSGQPAQGVRMLMNGVNSLNANAQPLVVIDGVIQNMQWDSPSLHDGFFNNLLGNIMVEDIEKVSVMKNGTAIYGAKGANGVLVIETKRNKSMATKIDVSLGGTWELVPKHMDMMNAEQMRVYASELIGSTGTKTNSFKFLQTDPKYYYYQMYHNQTDWSKEVHKQAFAQQANINVQGGDDIANYNLSVGYAGADGTVKDFSFSRFNLRLNTDLLLTKDLTVRFDASYSDVTRNMRDDGVKQNVTDGLISSPAFLALTKAPFLSPYAYDANGDRSDYLAEADDYLSDVLGQDSQLSTFNSQLSLANPVSILQNGEGKNKNAFGNRTVSIAVKPEWRIGKGWTLTDHFAFQLVNTDENYYVPTTGVPEYKVEGIGVVENCASALAGRQITIMNDLGIVWKRRWKGHLLEAKGGWRYLRDTYKLNTQVGYNTGNDKTPNMSSALEYKQTGGLDDRDVDLTYYVTADYNWAERYYVAATVALDGSSKFGEDAKEGVKLGNYAFGAFPSVEGAWVMTNERWWKPNKWVNHLKLNGGFDLVGNDDVNSVASRTYFVSRRMLNALTGISMGNIGNTHLQWETTARFTIGAQGSFFDNRLWLSFNYFNANTYNLLSMGELSYISGLETNWLNDGRVRNQGIDVSANVKLLSVKDWTWSVSASLGHYQNRVKRLPGGRESMVTELYGANVMNRVGSATGQFYGYKTDGVFSTVEEANDAGLYQLTETGTKQYFKAGDMKFVDVDGNHCIDQKDMQVIGDPNPDIYGNFSTQLTWKNLALSASFNYSVGGDIYNYQRSILESGAYFYNQTTNMLSRWTHDGQQTMVPRASYMDEMGNSRFSDRWIEDGSYLKLKNVTLSYRIPVRSTYLQGITIWAGANNLFTLTKYLGTDPEFSATNAVIGMGIDRGLMAPGRSFSMGMKINL